MRLCNFFGLLTLMIGFLTASPSFAVTDCTPVPNGGSAKDCLNKACSSVGQTTLDSDNVNIIACLATSATVATPIWKAMTTTSSLTTYSTHSGVMTGDRYVNQACKTGTIVSGGCYADDTGDAWPVLMESVMSGNGWRCHATEMDDRKDNSFDLYTYAYCQ